LKIKKLSKNAEGGIVDLDVEMTDQENAFFVGVALNMLLSQGLLRLNEEANSMEFNGAISEPDPNENPSS